MHILITGGAGFIGSFLSEHLLSLGHSVTVLDNLDPQVHPFSQPAYLPGGVRLLVKDVRDREGVQEAIQDADAVIHGAAAVGVAQSLYRVHHYVDVNVGGTALLLELLAARPRPVRKLLVLTSMTGYGEGLYRRAGDGALVRVEIRAEAQVKKTGWEPVCFQTGQVLEPMPTPEDAALLARNVYALSKRYQEELALSLGQIYGFPVTCLRLFNVYGPRQSLSNPYTGVLAIFLSRLLNGRAPRIYEDGHQTRDFISVHDVVAAAAAALIDPAADGQVINIGSGIPRRIVDCALVLADLLGCPDIKPEISGRFRKGDIRHCTADISRAQRVLGFKPRVRWEDGLAELIAWARLTSAEDNFQQAEEELRQRGLVTQA